MVPKVLIGFMDAIRSHTFLFSVFTHLHKVRPHKIERFQVTNDSSIHSFRVLGLNVG